jgi:hypothetical protein
MDIFQTEDEYARRLLHEFTVQSLLFAFDILEWLGYRPSSDGNAFWIGDAEGNPIDKESSRVDSLANAVKVLEGTAPLAVGAMSRRGTPSPEGTDAGGALMEAYDRWTNREQD